MAFDTFAVANKILELGEVHGVEISPLKLQKLVYYAHGWYLAATAKPLINDRFEAWKYGPVVATLFKQFKDIGNGRIDRKARKLQIKPKPAVVAPELPDDTEDARLAHKVIEAAFTKYKIYSPMQLSRLTHMTGTPWDMVHDLGVEPGTSTEIPDALIRDYFLRQAGEQPPAESRGQAGDPCG